MADGPELIAAKRLLDAAKSHGFRFERLAPGADGPLRGVRDTPGYRDEMYLAGFGAPGSCTAIRRRRCPLILPGGLPVTDSVTGDALTVLHTVVTEWAATEKTQTQVTKVAPVAASNRPEPGWPRSIS